MVRKIDAIERYTEDKCYSSMPLTVWTQVGGISSLYSVKTILLKDM